MKTKEIKIRMLKERLIFLIRTNQTHKENIGEQMDKLKISWKIQNKIAYLAKNTNKYINTIIKEA